MSRAIIRHLDSRPVHTKAQRDRALKRLEAGQPIGKPGLELFSTKELSALHCVGLITQATYAAELERRARWTL